MKYSIPLTPLFISCMLLSEVNGQELTIFNPQVHYDEPGGLYDPLALREMHVTFEDAEYHATLVDAFFNNPSLRIPATVELDGVVLDSIGARYKGNSTFCLPNDDGSPKVPYNLDFNYWIPGQDCMGYNKVKLANAWLDPTYCKEFISSRIYRNYMPTPEINLVQLFTQDDYTGLYVNTESINRQFLNKHFDENDGVLFKCDGAGVFCDEGGNGTDGGIPNLNYLGPDTASYFDSYTIKSENGWGALLDLITTLEFNPENLSDILNIDRVLWAMAANTVVSNLDTYNGYYVHNYYLYQDEQGRFQMIPWDLDNSFVGAIMGWSYWNPNDVYHFNPFHTGSGPAWDDRPLTQYLFNHPMHRKRYIAHIRTIMEEAMDSSALQQDIDEVQSLAYEAAAADNNSLFPMTFFTSNVNNAFWADWGFGGILSTVDARMEYLANHPDISEVPPTLGTVTALGGVIKVDALNAEYVDLMWANGPGTFEAVALNDDGTQGDAIAGDGTYAVQVPSGALGDFIFYIRATNEEAMALSPARAEYEYYIYDPALDNSEFDSDNFAGTNDWTLAPNPARDSFVLQNCAETVPLTIRDFRGRVIEELTWTGHPIDVSLWDAGVYFVHASNGNAGTVQRLIVQ